MFKKNKKWKENSRPKSIVMSENRSVDVFSTEK